MSPQPMTCREALEAVQRNLLPRNQRSDDHFRALAVLAALVEEHEAECAFRDERIPFRAAKAATVKHDAIRRTRALERGER